MTFPRSRSIVFLAIVAATGLAAGTAAAQSADATYSAPLNALNSSVTGSEAGGTATLVVKGDELTITVDAHGVPANTVHWQHFHGFTTGVAASCADASADANGDGIVDLMETEAASGTTMVPFDADPAAMDVAHGTYPTADAEGNYHYTQTVSMKALQAAFGKAFDGQTLDLGKRVIYIHGVPAATELPASVASLGPIPAQVTLPIACGKFTAQ